MKVHILLDWSDNENEGQEWRRHSVEDPVLEEDLPYGSNLAYMMDLKKALKVTIPLTVNIVFLGFDGTYFSYIKAVAKPCLRERREGGRYSFSWVPVAAKNFLTTPRGGEQKEKGERGGGGVRCPLSWRYCRELPCPIPPP